MEPLKHYHETISGRWTVTYRRQLVPQLGRLGYTAVATTLPEPGGPAAPPMIVPAYAPTLPDARAAIRRQLVALTEDR